MRIETAYLSQSMLNGTNEALQRTLGGRVTRGRAFIVFAAIVVFLFWSSTFTSVLGSRKPKLHLTNEHTFHIAIFSDLHYGEDEHSFGIEQDVKSTALMRQVLESEQPDFVVLNGDLITGENTFAFNSSQYVHRIVEPLVEGGYGWASTYGNHDSKFNLSRESILSEETKYANSFTQRGPAGTDGITNYMLPIYASKDTSKGGRSMQKLRSKVNPKPVVLLWFFDSRGGADYQHEPADADNIGNHVSEGTASWFKSAAAKMHRKYGTIPSLAFVHIPMKAFVDLQFHHDDPQVHSSVYPGLNDDVPLAQQGYSDTGDEAIPFMQALLDTPGLHSVYSAHDHGNSWCGRWRDKTLSGYGYAGQKRPFLCFCKHSGFGGYGKWNRGVRQIKMTIGADGLPTVDTWVRLEQDNIVQAVTLNETYGKDVYPDDDGGYHPNKDD